MNQSEVTVRQFWLLMGSSQFTDVRTLLADSFHCRWPLTREHIPSPDAFVQIQIDYPGSGSIDIEELVAEPAKVVTVCAVHWGGSDFTVISHFTVAEDGLLSGLVEWWPEPYEPPSGRQHLVQRY